MMTKKMWPNDYPTHITVPPQNAKKIGASLFRMVSKTVPDADDFLASYKDPKQKHLARYPRFSNKSGFYGTSFFDTKTALHDLIEGSPEKFAGVMVALGDIKPDHGLGYQSKKSGHVSIWFYEGVYPKGFKVV